jgi:hypothetical protein
LQVRRHTQLGRAEQRERVRTELVVQEDQSRWIEGRAEIEAHLIAEQAGRRIDDTFAVLVGGEAETARPFEIEQ